MKIDEKVYSYKLKEFRPIEEDEKLMCNRAWLYLKMNPETKFEFSGYYKYVFTYKTEILLPSPDGKGGCMVLVKIHVGGNSDDIYRLDLSPNQKANTLIDEEDKYAIYNISAESPDDVKMIVSIQAE